MHNSCTRQLDHVEVKSTRIMAENNSVTEMAYIM